MVVRIGFGYDVHRLETGLPFWLGGIKVEHNKGCVAHSDGDCLIHALCDAILGAAALRDIGYHFPDTDNTFKNIDSKILLQKTIKLISAQGFKIGNTDITICLQKPKIAEFIPQMIQCLSDIMQVPTSDINIKATTTEKLGFVGMEEGIAVYAVCTIYPIAEN
ncbi:MAG: 2-C-methyl-D-erythritol 2,4-cyclodiphosphate synthase [Bacteroidales bacterium]